MMKRRGTVRQGEMMVQDIRAWMVQWDGFWAEQTPTPPVAMKANPLMTPNPLMKTIKNFPSGHKSSRGPHFMKKIMKKKTI